MKRYIANRNMIVTSDADFVFNDLSMGSTVYLKAGTYFIEQDEENPKQFEVENYAWHFFIRYYIVKN